MSVADAEHWRAGFENLRIDVGAAWFVNTSGAARDDDAFTRSECEGWRVTRLNLGVDAQFTDATGDQMSILTAGIENSDLWFSGSSRQN